MKEAAAADETTADSGLKEDLSEWGGGGGVGVLRFISLTGFDGGDAAEAIRLRELVSLLLLTPKVEQIITSSFMKNIFGREEVPEDMDDAE